MACVNIQNLKTRTEVLLEDRLEKIRSGEIRLKVYDQLDEVTIEKALANFDRFEEQAIKWLSEGADIGNIPPIVWAYQLSGR